MVNTLRLRTVWAVAARDIRRVRGQRRRAGGMLGLALALVVPLAAVPCGGAAPKEPASRRGLRLDAAPASVLAATGAELVPGAPVSVRESVTGLVVEGGCHLH